MVVIIVIFHLLSFIHLFYFFSQNEGKVAVSETEATLKDIICLFTGSDRIPPMGFDRKSSIIFYHREDSKESWLPSVSTFLPKLQLPVCDSLTEDYDVFKEKMNLAVLGSVGFGHL